MLRIFLHVGMCVTDIQIMNHLRYNVQFNIWYCDKISYRVKIHHFREHVQTEKTNSKFGLPIVSRMVIRNPCVYILPWKCQNTEICTDTTGFINFLVPRFISRNLKIVVL